MIVELELFQTDIWLVAYILFCLYTFFLAYQWQRNYPEQTIVRGTIYISLGLLAIILYQRMGVWMTPCRCQQRGIISNERSFPSSIAAFRKEIDVGRMSPWL